MVRGTHLGRRGGAAAGVLSAAALLFLAAACGNNSGPDPTELLGSWDYRLAYRDSVTLDTLRVTGIITIDQAADTTFNGTFTLREASPGALSVGPTAPVTGVVAGGLVEFEIAGSPAAVTHRGDYDSSVMFGIAQATPAVTADTLLFTMWWSSENRP